MPFYYNEFYDLGRLGDRSRLGRECFNSYAIHRMPAEATHRLGSAPIKMTHWLEVGLNQSQTSADPFPYKITQTQSSVPVCHTDIQSLQPLSKEIEIHIFLSSMIRNGGGVFQGEEVL